MRTLPHNYRTIPAKKWYLMSVVVLEAFLFISLVAAVAYLVYFYNKMQNIRTQDLKNLYKWENLTSKYPNYPEGYYNAALYATKVGDREKALTDLNKSLRLNPNYAPGIELQKELDR